MYDLTLDLIGIKWWKGVWFYHFTPGSFLSAQDIRGSLFGEYPLSSKQLLRLIPIQANGVV
jgi:hypothetical protein